MTLGAARVIWTINDLSMFIDAVMTGYVTFVIKAERGPIADPRPVASVEEYRRIFGLKVDYTTDPLVCEMALRQGARLNIIRTAHYEDISDPATLAALQASATIGDRGASITHGYLEATTGPYTFIQSSSGNTTGTVEGPFTIASGANKVSFKVRTGGVWGAAVTATLVTGSKSASAIATAISALTGVGAEAHHGKVHVFAENVEDDLEVAVIAEDAYSVLGLVEGQYLATTGEDYLALKVDSGSEQDFSLAYNSTYSGRVTTSGTLPVEITDSNKVFKIRVRHSGTWGSASTINLTKGASVDADTIAADIAAIDDVSAEALDTGYILISATNVFDDIEIMAVTNDCYTALGLTEGVYLRTPTTYPGSIFTLTASQVASQITAAGLEGATATVVDGRLALRSGSAGEDSSLEILSTSTAHVKLGLAVEEVAGCEGEQEDTATFIAKDPGDWGNNLIVYIYDSALNPRTRFDVKIVYTRQSTLTEWYPNLSMDPTDSMYFANYINERSNLVTVTDEHSSNDFYTNVGWLNRPELSDVYIGVPLSGGTNGLDGFCDYDWIGDPAAQTGMYACDKADMTMDLMIPGTTSATVYQAMIAYAELRADLICYGMIPYGLDPADAVDWRLGNAPWSHPAFNSHRFALFYGRPLVYDDMDDSRKYISNLGHLASCITKTDANYGSSHAPVGPRRGTVSLVEGIDYNIQTNRTTGYADLFAENGINYLMISRYKGIEGAMFWEQRTTQRSPSATRELNVMRFITVINISLMPVLRTFIFEPNHPVTWREVHRTLEPAFENWKIKYDIYDYALQTDRDAFFDGGVLKNAYINSGLDIDRGIYHCRALIQPTRTIYYLEFTLGITRTGEAFEQFKGMYVLPGWIRS